MKLFAERTPILEDINFIFKIVEWVLCSLTCLVMMNPRALAKRRNFRDVVLVTSTTYFIITFTLFIVYIYDESNVLHEAIILIPGAAFALVSRLMCAIYFSMYERDYTLLAAAIMMLTCGVIMVVDFIYLILHKFTLFYAGKLFIHDFGDE